MKKREFVGLLFASIITIFVSAFTIFSVKNKPTAVIKVNGKTIKPVKLSAWERTSMKCREWNWQERMVFEENLKRWENSKESLRVFHNVIKNPRTGTIRYFTTTSDNFNIDISIIGIPYLASTFALLVKYGVIEGVGSQIIVEIGKNKKMRSMNLVIVEKYKGHENKDLNRLVEELRNKKYLKLKSKV